MSRIKKISAIALVLCVVIGIFAACSASPEKKLIGEWRDSTGTTGYAFKEGNICEITYADVVVPIINIPYKGTIDGAYAVDKRDDGNYYVTITYTLLAKSISESYMFTVDGSVLTLTSVDTGVSKTLMAYNPEAPTAA